jgi:vacuole morphology and inheritance protein 14
LCRYAASEALYNIAKVARSLVLPYMNRIFDVLAKVIADTDEKSQQGAGLLDRLFKDIVSEMDAEISVEPFVELVAQRMWVTNSPHALALPPIPSLSIGLAPCRLPCV